MKLANRNELKNADWSKMKVNVHEDELFDWEKAPVFSEFPEFQEEIGRDDLPKSRVLKFIAYFYDRHTPLLAVPDFVKRRVLALEYAGFRKDKETGEFSESVLEMVAGDNKTINRMIVTYVRSHKDDIYSYFMILQDAYYNELANMRQGGSSGIKNLDSIRERMDDERGKLVNNDESRSLYATLLEYHEKEALMLKPEDIAHERNEGGHPFSDRKVS